ncbi:MAG: hypothetical protein FWF99_03280 [Desulfovibrionaceae bacterium]|nr:hypothetical protein [Desulfovibrionaceae bacterium]
MPARKKLIPPVLLLLLVLPAVLPPLSGCDDAPPAEMVSLAAYLDGQVRTVAAPFAGELIFTAKVGENVASGGELLRVNALRLVSTLEETQKKYSELYHNMPEGHRRLLEAYARLLEEDPEGGETRRLFLEAEKNEAALRLDLEEASGRQAAVSLRARRLEIKKNRSAQENQRLAALRAEETLGAERLKEAQERYSQTSLLRADLKKRLDRQEAILRALNSAPPQLQEKLSVMNQLSLQILDLEKNLELAGVAAPEEGLVIFRLKRVGERINAGENALCYLAGTGSELSLTALFAPALAKEIRSGSPCVAEIGGLRLPGLVSAPLPYVRQGRDTPVPFRVVLDAARLEELGGLDPELEIRVRVENIRNSR